MCAVLLPPRAQALLYVVCALSLLSAVTAFDELSATRLTGCALVENPYVKVDPTQRLGYNGIAITYLHKLQDVLQFRINVHRWNRTWSEFIDHMSSCVPPSNRDSFPSLPPCECDIGIGSFTMTNERANRIQFVWPFSNEAHQMVSRRSDLLLDESENRWFVFQTFSLNVWILIVACIVLHAIGTVYFGSFDDALEHPINRSSPHSKSFSCWPVTYVLYHLKRFPALVLHSYAHLIGQPIQNDQMGTPSFHRSAWIVLGITTGLFLLTLYQASLTVLIFESKKSSPFRTLDDIIQCSVDPQRVAILRGGASQDFWNKVVNTSRNRENCKWEHSSVGITVSNLEEGFRFLSERKADFFYSLQGSVVFRATITCREFVPVGDPFFSTSVAFVLPRTTNETIHHHLDNATRFLREEDPFPTADALARDNSCGDEIEATITLEKLMAFSIMYVAAWLFLVGYRCVFLWRRRRRRCEQQQQHSLRCALIIAEYSAYVHKPSLTLSFISEVTSNERIVA